MSAIEAKVRRSTVVVSKVAWELETIIMMKRLLN